MKRFTRAYLTIALILILVINAAVIVLYSHRFFFQAAEDTSCLTTANLPGNCPISNDPGVSMVMINIGFFVVLFFVYFAVRHVYLSQRQQNDNPLDR